MKICQVTERAGGIRQPESFDRAASDYDRYRLGYPPQVVEVVLSRGAIGPSSRVLEVACGTGQLSIDLARSGCELVAVEMGPNLARLARGNLASFPRARVEVGRFEQWPLDGETFDAVVCASAFHWLDPELRYAKSAEALRPGGSLVILHAHHVSGGTPGLVEATQPLYMKWGLSSDPFFSPTSPEKAPLMYAELESSQLFSSVERHRLEIPRRLSTEAYVGWLRTDSLVLSLSAEDRSGFLADIGELVETRFSGNATRNFVYEVILART